MNKETQRKYDFMKFNLKELENIYLESFRRISNIDAENFFKNFCSQCYFFKDWLIVEFPEKKKEIENYISNNKWISICADFTNADKHKKLKNFRYNKKVEHGNNHTFLNFDEVKGINCRSIYTVKVGDDEIDSLEIAQKSFDSWNEYLKINLKLKI